MLLLCRLHLVLCCCWHLEMLLSPASHIRLAVHLFDCWLILLLLLLPCCFPGSLQLSCWCSCWHDLLDDWRQQQAAAAPAGGADGVSLAASSEAESLPPWGTAATPPAGAWHLAFAPNAGLPAFPSWLPSLQLLAAAAAQGDATASKDDSCKVAEGRETADAGSRCHTPVVFSDYCEEAAVRSQQMAAALLAAPFTLPPRCNPFRQPAPAASHGTRLPACSNACLFGWV